MRCWVFRCKFATNIQQWPLASTGNLPFIGASVAIRFSCPTCGTIFAVNDELVGRKARCSTCQSVVIVPPAHREPESESQPQNWAVSASNAGDADDLPIGNEHPTAKTGFIALGIAGSLFVLVGIIMAVANSDASKPAQPPTSVTIPPPMAASGQYPFPECPTVIEALGREGTVISWDFRKDQPPCVVITATFLSSERPTASPIFVGPGSTQRALNHNSMTRDVIQREFTIKNGKVVSTKNIRES